MFDNSITANKTMGVLTNHRTDSINWNSNMIKNPINHAALMDRKMQNPWIDLQDGMCSLQKNLYKNMFVLLK